MPVEIQDVLERRLDLGTFLVHLTKGDAASNLANIIKSKVLEARSPFGMAHAAMSKAGFKNDSQKCVCFSEVPLQFVSLLTQPIKDRQVEMKPYGIAVTKKQARAEGVNPVWYLDQSRGRSDWLTGQVANLVQTAISSKDENNSIFRLAPFIEHFGTVKDFSWEREWRCLEGFNLSSSFLLIAPERDHEQFQKLLKSEGFDSVPVIDCNWSLEHT